MIKQAHDILSRNSNTFTNFGGNGYWIQSQSKPSWNYQLLVQDNLTYPDFKFVSLFKDDSPSIRVNHPSIHPSIRVNHPQRLTDSPF